MNVWWGLCVGWVGPILIAYTKTATYASSSAMGPPAVGSTRKQGSARFTSFTTCFTILLDVFVYMCVGTGVGGCGRLDPDWSSEKIHLMHAHTHIHKRWHTHINQKGQTYLVLLAPEVLGVLDPAPRHVHARAALLLGNV